MIPASTSRRRLDLVIGLALVASTVAVYAQVGGHDFVNWDDPEYVTGNPWVRQGLTPHGLRWAFGATHAANWHPLTWVSHMVNVELFGLNAVGHHLVSLLFHVLNTLLVFHVFRRMTGARWRSAFVAALFALHPLHVESVAWVSERKDVLSTLFWLLTMWAYARYAERPSTGRYGLVLSLFAAGLMAKPMLVTLPFVLLLLDYWPLGRLRLPSRGLVFDRRLVWEKLPLFALAAVSSAVTFLVQRASGAVLSLDVAPLDVRLANGLVAYVGYLSKTIWPHPLAVPYPYPAEVAAWKAGGALLVLAAVTFLAVRFARVRPYGLVGWLWYLGTLVPVIGFVQVGKQAMADRYTYVPLLGIFVVLAWGAADLMERWRHRRGVSAAAATAVLGLLALFTFRQVGVWSDTISLFGHAVRVTEGNAIAHTYLGVALEEAGDVHGAVAHLEAVREMDGAVSDAPYTLGLIHEERGDHESAARHYRLALRLQPDHANALNNLGRLLRNRGRPGEALAHYEEAVRRRPDFAPLRNNLGVILTESGRPDEAIEHLEEAVRLNPEYVEAHNNLGMAHVALGRYDEAMGHYERALELDLDYLPARYNMGVAMQRAGRLEQAVSHFERAVRMQPDAAEAHAGLGDTWARLDRPDKAADAYSEALRIDAGDAAVHEKLGVVLLAQGRLDEAVASFERALEIAPDNARLRGELLRLEGSRGR